MDWKLGYGSLGLIAALLIGGLAWCNVVYAPIEVSAVIQRYPPPIQNPYTRLAGKKVHINTATEEQLQELPNIGPKRAQEIRDYIRKYGKLATIKELLEIEGIGEKTLEELKPYISLD